MTIADLPPCLVILSAGLPKAMSELWSGAPGPRNDFAGPASIPLKDPAAGMEDASKEPGKVDNGEGGGDDSCQELDHQQMQKASEHCTEAASRLVYIGVWEDH